MNVYIKKEDKRKGPHIGIFITFAFVVISVYIAVMAFKSVEQMNESNEPIMLIILCAIWLYGLSIDILSMGLGMMITILKKPKKYKAVLLKKEEEIYNGKQISYMTFALKNKSELQGIPNHFFCYTIGENDFEVDSFYTIN